MTHKKLYPISDIALMTGISTNQVRYIANKHNISHEMIKNRRYFDGDNTTQIINLAQKIYSNTKSPKYLIDYEYRAGNLEKKLLRIQSILNEI